MVDEDTLKKNPESTSLLDHFGTIARMLVERYFWSNLYDYKYVNLDVIVNY